MRWKTILLTLKILIATNFYFLLLKKGIKKTKHAKKKKILPAIDQKLPILDMIKQIEEIINKTHPKKFIVLLVIVFV